MDSSTVFRMALTILSGIGLYTCWHFAAAQFGWSNYHAVKQEILCGTEAEQSCTKLSSTPYAKLILIPNWYWGTAFYCAVLLSVIVNITSFYILITLGSLASVAMGLYLVWALVVKLKFFCAYCYTAHATNLALLLLLLWKVL